MISQSGLNYKRFWGSKHAYRDNTAEESAVTAILLASEYIDKIRHDEKPIAGRTIGFKLDGGDDETRTRDLRRDRPAF